MTALLAIAAWLSLGLALTGIAWGLSRWLGKPAASTRGIAGGGRPVRPAAVQDTDRTHVGGSL